MPEPFLSLPTLPPVHKEKRTPTNRSPTRQRLPMPEPSTHRLHTPTPARFHLCRRC